MKVLIIHIVLIYTGIFIIISCGVVGVYSLTGSVSSSSGEVPPQLLVATNYSLVHDARVKVSR